MLPDETEFPAREWPDVPLWTENYCYVCYDPQVGYGLTERSVRPSR